MAVFTAIGCIKTERFSESPVPKFDPALNIRMCNPQVQKGNAITVITVVESGVKVVVPIFKTSLCNIRFQGSFMDNQDVVYKPLV